MPVSSTIVTMAHLAAAGSRHVGAASALPPGFVPVTAEEIGFRPQGGQSLVDGTYRFGNAQAFVAKGVIDGKETLVLAFSATDDEEDRRNNAININQNYENYRPLVDAIDATMAGGGFEQLAVTGHSLGGAMTQVFMSEHKDDNIVAVTFGSPGARIPDGPDPRITNVVNLDDPIVYIGQNTSLGFPGTPFFVPSYQNRGTDVFLPRADGGSAPIGSRAEAQGLDGEGHPIGAYIARATAALAVAQGQAPEPVVAWHTEAGQFSVWTLEGTSAPSKADWLTRPSPNWTAVGLGDADGDTRTDIFLVRYNGILAVTEPQDGVPPARNVIGAAGPGWRFAAVGDLDGDARSDVVWRHEDGSVQAWLLQGTKVLAVADLGARDPSWTIAGVGDFDGDGRTDLLWRNEAGAVEAWLMHGGARKAEVRIGQSDPGWTMATTGDLDGDGRSDIVWQAADGEVRLWDIGPGATLAGQGVIGRVAAGVTVEDAVDVSRDGRDDLIGRASDGTLTVWVMDGGTVLDRGTVGAAPAEWQLIG